ncbi:MAG: hypothetical protein IJ489_08785 [Clostridia bacterium]|nr:hypothetical protein [Clostridia bacterium]
MKTYTLYVGRYQKLPEDIRYSFYDAEAKELLILTENDPPRDFIFVPDSHLSFLTKSEREWLFACKLKINAEFVKNNEKELTEYAEVFLDTLETALNELEPKKKGGCDGEKRKENELVCSVDTKI